MTESLIDALALWCWGFRHVAVSQAGSATLFGSTIPIACALAIASVASRVALVSSVRGARATRRA